MILQSHLDYEDSIDLPSVSDAEFRLKSRKHREFIKQPLKLGMFIPCDENDVPLQEPQKEFKYVIGSVGYDEIIKYQQAKERVLFEGFEYKDGLIIMPNKQFLDKTKLKNLKVEHLLLENLKLTDSAIKQIKKEYNL